MCAHHEFISCHMLLPPVVAVIGSVPVTVLQRKIVRVNNINFCRCRAMSYDVGMRDFSTPRRNAPRSQVLNADWSEEWWWKPVLLSSSLAAVVFIHWLILR
jgi:hypothetical protein